LQAIFVQVTWLIACKQAPTLKEGKTKAAVKDRRRRDAGLEASLLLLRGEPGLDLLALEVSGPAFAFDVLVELLAHGVWKSEVQ
jgi:hypothetical protein